MNILATNIITNRAGFTLVELSIVLVIIGLLIGGILVGQSIMDSAKVNRLITDIGQYQVAARLYKEKTKFLPGDDPNALKYFGTTCGTGFQNQCSGNGDGKIDNVYWYGNETVRVFEHLYLSGLLKRTYKSTSGDINCELGECPLSAISKEKTGTNAGTYMFRYYDIDGTGTVAGGNYSGIDSPSEAGNYIVLRTGAYTDTGFITPTQAASLDNKVDDGMPGTGKTRSSNIFGTETCRTNTNPSRYSMNDNNVCVTAIKYEF